MSDQVTIALIGAGAATIAAICGVVTTVIVQKAAKVVQVLEKNTNSMKDELVKVTGDAARAKGKIEGAAEERESR